MFYNLLSMRAIRVGIAFFVLVVGGSLLYSWHVQRTTESDMARHDRFTRGLHNQTETRPAETGNVPTENEPPGLVNTPDETTDTPMSDETEALPNETETETLDLTDAFLPDDIATLEDPVLVELNSERLKLKQRRAELNAMFQDHFASVVGRKLTAEDTRHGKLVSGNADGLTESQVIAELEDLRSRSENLQKAQVEWRRKYIQHTGKEYPGTEHWVPFVARDPEEVEKLLQYEMGARDWFIVDP